MTRLILPPELTGPEHPEWFEARRQGVTASEIAAILGLSPWDSAFAIYHRKVGNLDDQPDNDVLSLGRHLEPWIASRWAERHPEFSVERTGLWAGSLEWMLASPDRDVYEDVAPVDIDAGPVAVAEIKSSGSYDGWGDEGTDEVPVYYRAQTLWQMAVRGVDTAYIACLFLPNRQIREYVITMDDAAEADLAVMLGAAVDFRRRLRSGDVPDIDCSDATTAALQELHPRVEDRDVVLDGELIAEYQAVKLAEKNLARTATEVSNRIRQTLGDAKRAIDSDGNRVTTRSVYEQSRIDVDRLRRERPDVAAEYTVTSTVDKLTAAPTQKRKTIA